MHASKYRAKVPSKGGGDTEALNQEPDHCQCSQGDFEHECGQQEAQQAQQRLKVQAQHAKQQLQHEQQRQQAELRWFYQNFDVLSSLIIWKVSLCVRGSLYKHMYW